MERERERCMMNDSIRTSTFKERCCCGTTGEVRCGSVPQNRVPDTVGDDEIDIYPFTLKQFNQ